MGVTGLWKLIEQSGKPVPLDTLEGKILAIDISIWLHQVTKGIQDGRGGAVQNAHLLGLFNRLCKLLYWRIKPVFIFDGGVPQLKRATIEKRSMQRSKTNAEANRIEQVLLETLAQEKIVQQALGRSVEHLVSPSKNRPVKTKKSEDDIFMLPPSQSDLGVNYLEQSDDEAEEAVEPTASTELQHDIMDFFEKNIMKVDVNSALFKSLPPDKRHSILFEMKESRKQSSWGRLHEMPDKGDSFADFQMKRLLKRRQVQVSLEEAENEMGGRCLTFGELENLMAEDGILEQSTDILKGQRIASDESTRFLLVKDIKKAIEDSKKSYEEEQIRKINEPSSSQGESQEEFDLQMAIAMSLQDNNDIANLTQVDVAKTSEIQLSTPQRVNLKHAAKASARDYMLEFGILNDDDIQDMFKKNEVNDKNEQTDKSITQVENISSEEGGEPQILTPKILETTKEPDTVSITSSTDSDFIDVPEDDFSDAIITPVHPYPLPDSTPSKEFRIEDLKRKGSVEVIVDPTKLEFDDMFADIFTKPEVNEQKRKKIVENLLPVKDDHKNLKAEEAVKNILSADEIVEKEEENEFQSPTKKIRLEEPGDETKESSESVETIKATNIPEIIESHSQKSIQMHQAENITVEFESTEKASPSATAKGTEDTQINEIDTKTLSAVELNNKSPKIISKSTGQLLISPMKSSEGHKEFTDHKKPHESAVKASKTPKKLIDLTKDEPKPSTSTANLFLDKLASKSQTTEEDEVILKQMEQELAQKHQQLEREINKMDRHAVSITDKMSLECQSLLRLFGIPFLVAPMEAEAQCAFLNAHEFVDGIISDDSDVWLFGGNTVYKNFFDNNKIVLEFKANNIERLFKMDRKKLIQLAFLVGSDYTTGLHGVGPVTALEIIAAFTTSEDCSDEAAAVVSCLRKFREWWNNGKNSYSNEVTVLKAKLKSVELGEGFPNIEVARAYLYPEVDISDEQFAWGNPDVDGIYDFAKRKLGWTQSKTDDIFGPVMKRLNEKTSQATITNYFKVKSVERRQDLVVSKRVERAVRKLAGDEIEDDVVPKKKRKSKKDTKGEEKSEGASKPKGKRSKNKSTPNKKSKVETVDIDFEETIEIKDSQESTSQTQNSPPLVKSPNSASIEKKETSKTEKIIKVPRIPDPNPPIMQRVKDQKEQEEAKIRAAELFKKTRSQKKKAI